MSKSSSQNKIVYQEFGQVADSTSNEEKTPELTPQQQKLTIKTSKAGRKGKTVTIISGFQCSASTLIKLLKQLKTKCGTGGTVKENTLEIQGDRISQLKELLTQLGYKVGR
jgi:translation initiation factor 1